MKVIIIGFVVAALWGVLWMFDSITRLFNGELMPSLGYALVGIFGAAGIFMFAVYYGARLTIVGSEAEEVKQ